MQKSSQDLVLCPEFILVYNKLAEMLLVCGKFVLLIFFFKLERKFPSEFQQLNYFFLILIKNCFLLKLETWKCCFYWINTFFNVVGVPDISWLRSSSFPATVFRTKKKDYLGHVHDIY